MEWEDDLTGMEWKNRVGLLCIIREPNQGVFERRTSTGSEDFSLLIRLDAVKFVLLNFFTLVEMI